MNPPPRAVQKYQRGQQLLQQRDIQGGLKLIREAADAAKQHRDIQIAAATTFHRVGRVAEGAEFYRRCLKLNHNDHDARVGLGQCLKTQGDHARALEMFDAVLAAKPGHYLATASRAELLVDEARHDAAIETIDELKTLPGDAMKPYTIALLRARMSPRTIDPDDVVPELEAVAMNESIQPRARGTLFGELGRLEERRGNHDEAFAAYAAAKRVFRPPWDGPLHTRRVSEQIEKWTDAFARIPQASMDGPEIVFILGMPRSGTTLIEQMLAQLEGVVAGGEQSVVSQIVGEREPPPGLVQPLLTDLGSLNQRTIDAIAADAIRRYAERVKHKRGELFTDKQPGNYYYIPLILKLFPRARIIHCTRDPMDVCLSNFAISFGRPHPETHDLADLGVYYKDYERLTSAWADLAGDRMTEAVYEDVVADTETHARRLVEFIGNDWDDAVLRFHESERTARTASREQVRQKVYTSSVKRHEKFGEHLRPLRDALGR